MKTKNKNLWIAAALAILLFVGAVLGLTFGLFKGGAQGSGELTLIGGEIQENYILNDFIEIPAAKLSYGGETKDAEISVITPSGERVRSANVKLTEGGKYKAEYKALFSGRAKTVEKAFTVNIPLFSKNSKKTVWEYGVDDSAYQTGKEGVKVTLAKDDTLTYNDVIDLRKSNGQIIDFFLLPSGGVATKDVKKIVLTVTDLHDPNVYLTIILQCANDHGGPNKWWFDWTYVLAGGQNQKPTGIEGKGTDKEKVWVDADWGSVVKYSFYGTYSNGGGASVVGKESLSVSYSQTENIVYVNGTEIMDLSDLKYMDDIWGGFTNGEVKLSIEGENFTLGTAEMMITKLGSNSLKGEYFVDDVAPAITVDFGEYDENSLPMAGKGLTYPVFNATAKDKVCGSVPVQTTVYYNYESQQRYQVNVKDGCFETKEMGYYTIEYLCYDSFKNESKKLVKVYCGEATPDLTVEAAGAYETEVGTGAHILPAEIRYEGGTGAVKTYATAQAQGGEEFVIDEGFRPEIEGVYTIRLYAVDMLGKTVTFTYGLTVSINDKPVFIDEPILPKFFLVGYNYALPSIPAYDYSSGTQVETLETTIAIRDGKDGGQERALSGNETDFVADEYGFATVIYKATGAKGSNAVEYKVKVIDAWRDIDNYSIDMKKYFYGENLTVTDGKDGIKISAAADTSYIFANSVIAHRFETKFAITDGSFARLQFVFEDSKDASIRFTVEIDKSPVETENSYLKINGVALKYRPWAGFYNGKDFNLVYDEAKKTLLVDALYETVIKNADGSAFAGFPSGLVYVTMNVSGVNGNAEILWKNFAGQVLSNSDYDSIAPSIKLSGDYASKYSLGTVAEIYSAIAADVLSPEVYTKMTVRDPNGKIVTDVNGLKLQDVPFDKSYFIKLEMYGSYSVKYSAMDWMEREQEYPFALLVVDDKAPEITVEKAIKTQVKQGEKIEIYKATATDNVDGEISVYAYLVNPNGILSKVSFGEKVTLTMKGSYELRYMAVDKFGNLNIRYYTIKVA